ncbi:hypothetical protein M6B38_389430 [Iris pallida]|uniref:Uncharacterized protein n=1 Tax=Iris pallida TaxID=29817 RepID=A0AAX6G1M4_IRIPA|nr:hypothetical protein M6B38_389430 [Iris pallida]
MKKSIVLWIFSMTVSLFVRSWELFSICSSQDHWRNTWKGQSCDEHAANLEAGISTFSLYM